MNAKPTPFESPETMTRHDTIACSTVLVSMLVAALCGALVF